MSNDTKIAPTTPLEPSVDAALPFQRTAAVAVTVTSASPAEEPVAPAGLPFARRPWARDRPCPHEPAHGDEERADCWQERRRAHQARREARLNAAAASESISSEEVSSMPHHHGPCMPSDASPCHFDEERLAHWRRSRQARRAARLAAEEAANDAPASPTDLGGASEDSHGADEQCPHQGPPHGFRSHWAARRWGFGHHHGHHGHHHGHHGHGPHHAPPAAAEEPCAPHRAGPCGRGRGAHAVPPPHHPPFVAGHMPWMPHYPPFAYAPYPQMPPVVPVAAPAVAPATAEPPVAPAAQPQAHRHGRFGHCMRDVDEHGKKNKLRLERLLMLILVCTALSVILPFFGIVSSHSGVPTILSVLATGAAFYARRRHRKEAKKAKKMKRIALWKQHAAAAAATATNVPAQTPAAPSVQSAVVAETVVAAPIAPALAVPSAECQFANLRAQRQLLRAQLAQQHPHPNVHHRRCHRNPAPAPGEDADVESPDSSASESLHTENASPASAVPSSSRVSVTIAPPTGDAAPSVAAEPVSVHPVGVNPLWCQGRRRMMCANAHAAPHAFPAPHAHGFHANPEHVCPHGRTVQPIAHALRGPGHRRYRLQQQTSPVDEN